jgi:RNA polymerase sigma-70 factor (TIGR02957 family)
VTSVPSSGDGRLEAFTQVRSLLFTVAYEMLGSVADSEDVLQESWLRWDAGDRSGVVEPRAYLVRLVTRQALNRMRTLRRQRETYVGPWLPEPLATTPDVADDVELAESVSVAMLVVLETLTPLERAVFVLHDVFGFGYAEVAVATDRSVAACRQLASRARRHVEARRPRVSDRTDVQQVTERFLAAASSGAVGALLELLAPDVVLVADGGGVRRAALRPIAGADKVARFLSATGARVEGSVTGLRWASANGRPSVLMDLDGALDSLVTLDVRDGLVHRVYYWRNPAKLGHVVDPVPLTRE